MKDIRRTVHVEHSWITAMLARLPLHLLRFHRLWAWENGSLWFAQEIQSESIQHYSIFKDSRHSLHRALSKSRTPQSPALPSYRGRVCTLLTVRAPESCEKQWVLSAFLGVQFKERSPCPYATCKALIWCYQNFAWQVHPHFWPGCEELHCERAPTHSLLNYWETHQTPDWEFLHALSSNQSIARTLLYQQTNWTWRSLGSRFLCSPQRLRESLTGNTATSGTSTSHCHCPFTKKAVGCRAAPLFIPLQPKQTCSDPFWLDAGRLKS